MSDEKISSNRCAGGSEGQVMQVPGALRDVNQSTHRTLWVSIRHYRASCKLLSIPTFHSSRVEHPPINMDSIQSHIPVIAEQQIHLYFATCHSQSQKTQRVMCA